MSKSATCMAVTFILAMVAAGCATIEDDWAAAQDQNSIAAYERFLGQHPGSQYEPDATSRIDLINQEHEEAEKADQLRRQEEAQAELARLKVIKDINQLAADASPQSIEKLVRMLEGEIAKVETRPEFTTGIFPDGTIFLGALTEEGTLRKNLVDALGKTRNISAVPVLIRCLRDPERSIMTTGVNYVQGVTREGETYIFLVREAAAESLKNITGKELGQDVAKWQTWHAQNALQ
jgi:hypothetical protein